MRSALLATGLALALAATSLLAKDNAPAAAAPARTVLWNGRDLAGWSLFVSDPAVAPASVWSAHDGVLRLATKPFGYLRTEQSFANYHLHVEWRWPADAESETNSGVLLHLAGPDAIWPLCFECQLKNTNAGQVIGLGYDIPAAPLLNKHKRAAKFAAPSEHPLGQWNACEIYARGDTIEVFVNGTRQNHVTQLTATGGRIALQMEGYPIEFRSVWLEPL